MNGTMTVNIPADLQEQISNWSDGETYQVTLTQTGPMQFDLASIDGEGQGDTAQPEPGTDDSDENGAGAPPGSMADTGGTTIPSKNPAVAALIMTKRGKK